MSIKLNIMIVALISFFVTLLITKRLIKVFNKKEIGQKILDIGPNWHKSKEGTPTMGGISFIIAFICAFLYCIVVLIIEKNKAEILTAISIVVFVLLNSLIGLIDDLAKIKKNKNEGLKPIGKLTLQALSAVIFLACLKFSNSINTIIKIPLINFEQDLGFLFYVVAFFVICGFINAVNLTDGIDGLASSVSLTSGVFICVVAITIIQTKGLALVGGTIIGSLFAFLIYNLHPAKIFMGDTGSLFLGALIVSTSFLMENLLIIIFYGFVFICEAISVILQVLFFKITKGKRLFKMAPLHHHLEKSGWSESKIVVTFTFINAIGCILAYFILI